MLNVWPSSHRSHTDRAVYTADNMLSINDIRQDLLIKDGMLIMVSFSVPSLPLMHLHSRSMAFHPEAIINRCPNLPPLPCLYSLRRPDVLTRLLDPVAQLVDTAVPLCQTRTHAIDLLEVENLGLDPVDVCHLVHLIHRSPEQAQA